MCIELQKLWNVKQSYHGNQHLYSASYSHSHISIVLISRLKRLCLKKASNKLICWTASTYPVEFDKQVWVEFPKKTLFGFSLLYKLASGVSLLASRTFIFCSYENELKLVACSLITVPVLRCNQQLRSPTHLQVCFNIT